MSQPAAPPPTSRDRIDEALRELHAGKERWKRLPAADKAAVLRRLRRDLSPLGERWSNAAADAKGVPRDSREAGEEWLTFALLLRHLAVLERSIGDVAHHGRPRLPGRPRRLPPGQLAVPAFPLGLADRLLFPGVTAHVWLDPEIDEERLASAPTTADQASGIEGRVALVLGGGNATSLGPSDVLDKLFCEGSVVVFKVHPVTHYTGPLIEEGFRSLIDAGALRVVYGGVEQGAYLTSHGLVDELHITGSDRTFEAIVFGPGEEGARRKAAREPVNTRPFTCELGNVSPLIVVPGPWSAADLAFQGEHIASTMTMNAGFFCAATRVVVQHVGWRHRAALLDAVRDALQRTPTRPAYYPGARAIHGRFVSAHPDAEVFGDGSADSLPWTLVPGLDPHRADEPCFTTEAFCGLFAETALEAASPAEYIDRAVDFCNDRLWGTLLATIFVHPASLRDPETAAAVERAVRGLRYGTVAINIWGLYNFATYSGTWGAFPGHPRHDIQSGHGVVHNSLMLPGPEKTVIRGPFRPPVKPLQFPSHRTLPETGRRFAAFEANPGPVNLARLALAALRG